MVSKKMGTIIIMIKIVVLGKTFSRYIRDTIIYYYIDYIKKKNNTNYNPRHF